MAEARFALDSGNRTIDPDGRMHVGESNISKATISPYLGSEIPGYKSLGLRPDKVYKLYRDPDELAKAASTFERVPLMIKHIATSADEPQKDAIVGTVGSKVTFDAPYLKADISVWDGYAIAAITTDTIRELSCGYRYRPDMTPGKTVDGQAYDGIMRDIVGNHLALVEVGRAGRDVLVADSNPFKRKKTMANPTKRGAALIAALCAMSPVLAADAALPTLTALVGNVTKKTFDRKVTLEKLMAMDGDLDNAAAASTIDAIMDIAGDPDAQTAPSAIADPMPAAVNPVNKDAGPADQIKAILAGKIDDALLTQVLQCLQPAAVDNAPPAIASSGAMDAAIAKVRADMLALDAASMDVRPTVGDVHGMETAAAVYGFALDHLKVEHKGVEDITALKAMYKVAANKPTSLPTPRLAMDMDGAAKRWPGIARFA